MNTAELTEALKVLGDDGLRAVVIWRGFMFAENILFFAMLGGFVGVLVWGVRAWWKVYKVSEYGSGR